MASYYAIQPTRTSILLAHVDKQYFHWFYVFTATVTLGGVFFYNHIVSRYSRTQLIRMLFTATILCFAIFWALFSYLLPFKNSMVQQFDGSESALQKLFYVECILNGTASFYHVFICVYILFFTAIFWSFNHDMNTSQQSKVAYPYIFLGGQIGVIVGSKITQWASKAIGTYNLGWICVAGLLCCWGVLEILKRFDTEHVHKKLPSTGVSKDFKILLSSRYTLFIALIVILGTYALTLCDYQYKMLMNTEIPNREDQTAFLARNNSIMGVGNIIMSSVITPILFQILGPAFAIILFPVIIITTGAMFLFKISVYTAAIFAILVSCCYYTLYQVGKEIFYVPTDKVTKYKVKAFCDIFGYRLGDAFGSLTITIYLAVFIFVPGLSYILFTFTILWLWILVKMNSEYLSRVKQDAASSDPTSGQSNPDSAKDVAPNSAKV